MKFTVPISLPSKKNSYEIHRAGLRRWIAPSAEVVQAENTIALFAKVHLDNFDGPVTVKLQIHGKLDVDNAGGVALDGLQKSGRIGNDRNVRRLEIERFPGKNESITIEVIPYDDPV